MIYYYACLHCASLVLEWEYLCKQLTATLNCQENWYMKHLHMYCYAKVVWKHY